MLLALTLASTLASVWLASLLIYRAFLGPLRSVPGPWICRLTSWWTYYHSYNGDECSRIDELHKIYGPVVRIGPNEISIADGAALAPIYVDKGGFLKAPCYSNFDIEGHSTIFSTRDPAHRSIRSKAVVALFSTTNIRAGQAAIEKCTAAAMVRLKEDAIGSKNESERGGCRPVNVLNLSRSLALDAASSYLFGISFVGRFFFLPTWIFLAIENTRTKYFMSKAEAASTQKVGRFAASLTGDVKDPTTYQNRLLKAGLTEHEVKIQCEDLIFAGTDSTGTNMATIIWSLAKHPAAFRRLRQEVNKADEQDPSYPPQSLAYLDAVVREGLRLSMANPVRFPRIVPPQGFDFTASDGKQYFFPAGTQVGLQPYTLHYNEAVFIDPLTFNPERWLDATPAMQRDWIPFGLGTRQCIARNLAMTELLLATRALARENVLEGAEAVGERIEFLEWFNSRILDERIELIWR